MSHNKNWCETLALGARQFYATARDGLFPAVMVGGRSPRPPTHPRGADAGGTCDLTPVCDVR